MELPTHCFDCGVYLMGGATVHEPDCSIQKLIELASDPTFRGHTPGNYILIGQTPVVEPDLLTWARWFEESDRRVGETRVLDTARVSTVFLGLDHSFRGGPPILFESMAFWEDEGGYEGRRCSTWAEAEAMHREMVREVAGWRAWFAYCWRRWRDTVSSAREDWRNRWQEV